MGMFDGEAALVVGSVTGIRTFHTDKHGWLYPPSYDSTVRFGAGINYARCAYQSHYSMWGSKSFDEAQIQVRRTDMFGYARRIHPIGSAHCSCGFYAFRTYERSIISGYPRPTSVQAIVEGFGHVTVGTEGFRAEKLRIKAIVVPSVPRSDRFSRFSDGYIGSFWHLAMLLIGLAILFFNVVANFLWYDDWFGDNAAWVSWMILTVGMTPTWFNMAAFRYKKKYAGATSKSPALGYFEEVLPKIRENYPNIEIFTDPTKALKAYPVSNFRALAKKTEKEEKEKKRNG